VTTRILQGRTAFVTGGSRGIGAAIARALGEHGADVAVNYHSNAAAAEAVTAHVITRGGKAVAVQGDAGDAEQVERMTEQARAALGDIDLLVCNVIGDTRALGALFGATGSVVDSLDRVRGVREVTTTALDAALLPCHFVVPQMRRRGGGSIVFIGASGTHSSTPGLAEVSVAKSAQDALARSLAVELAPDGIRVNTVAPGLVPTDANAGPHQEQMIQRVQGSTPAGTVTTVDEVADTVVALASDLGRRVTGVFVPLDGARTLT
jgi:3-oxoacyl-[acyl-carrier protein] reductase